MDPAAQSLQELLFEQLSADDELAESAKELILAAFDGGEALSARLANTGPPGNEPDAARTGKVVAGTFLRSITVEGFRGIAGEQRLELAPGAGLTIVTGRNGSGKSSFAEAAEIALTGDNERWRNRTSGWSKGFRNIHHAGPAQVGVELLHEGSDKPVAIRRTWADGAELHDSAAFLQRRGDRREPYDAGMWSDRLTTYRPFLPYSELGKLINGKPSELHDALYALLGLEAFTRTADRIAAAEKTWRDDRTLLGTERKTLHAECAAAADERAHRAAALLAAAEPDLDALSELALGDDADAHAIAALRDIAAVILPDAQQVQQAADRISTAHDRARERRTDESTTAKAVAEMLRQGIAFHDTVGDVPCPVCGQGRLEAEWHQEAVRTATAFEQSSERLADAETELRRADAAARDLIAPIPDALQADAGLPAHAVAECWRRWQRLREIDEPTELAAELTRAHRELNPQLEELRQLAGQELLRRNEIWSPLARKVAHWHDRALAVRTNEAKLTSLRAAKNWLKRAGDELRDRRLQPFARETQRIWSRLRQQSSVDLDGLALVGRKTSRHVQVNVSVDGADSAALSVMSQGELHSLGLALFLPRATTAESPFRFLVIDDPVQAMDPAKVDGLAAVLSEVARERQVVVFTHDDRLTESVRRLRLPATVLEVCRRERSEVTLRTVQSPESRYLSDADALTKDAELPADVRGELVAGLCRSALEASAHAVFRARRLGGAHSHASVEQQLANAKTTHSRLTLAVLDDPSKDHELYSRLKAAGPNAVRTVKACKHGAHAGFTGELSELVRDTGRLVAWLRTR